MEKQLYIYIYFQEIQFLKMNFGKNYFNIISRKLTENTIDILSINNKFLQLREN